MKQFRIYQLPVEHSAKFMSLDFVKENNIMPKLEDYKLVYEGEFEPQGEYSEPDQIYMKFQGEKPEGYTGYSISMSDVVKIDGKYFYCDDFGWEEVFYQTENKKYIVIADGIDTPYKDRIYESREEAEKVANELNNEKYLGRYTWRAEEIEDETEKEEEAKRYGTTAESLEEQGFIFMEEACGDCHWFAPCAEFGGTLMSLAWYREQQKNFRNEHFKKNKEEKEGEEHTVTLTEPHIHFAKDGRILYGETKIGTYEKEDLWKKQGGTRDRSGNKTVPFLYYVTIDAMPTDRGKRIFFSRKEIKEWLSGKQITIDFNAA